MAPGSGKTLFEGGQGLEHLPALIPLYIIADLRSMRIFFLLRSPWRSSSSVRPPEIHPQARYLSEVLHKEAPFRLPSMPANSRRTSLR